MKKYDVIIIGGGLGGLECGVILSREGYNVCVLEKNAVTGGCLQSFSRNGHMLDTGIHYIGSMDEGQVLNQYLKYFGVLGKLKLKKLDEDAYDVVHYGGRDYKYGVGYHRFSENLINEFPKEKENIKRFSLLLKEIGSSISVENMKKGLISGGGMEYFGMSASAAIDGLINDETLKNVLAGTSGLYSGEKGSTNLYHYGMINHSFIEGPHRFVGGSQQLADALTDAIRTNGGEVFNSAEVSEMKTAGGRLEKVLLKTGGELYAKYFISSLHPAVTFGLVETPLIKKAYITRLNSLKNSSGIFTVYLIMKKNSFSYQNRNYYIYGNRLKKLDAWRTVFNQTEQKPESVLLSMQVSDTAQQHADVISLLCPITADCFAPWADTLSGKRGSDYRQYKERLTDSIIDFVSEYFPHLKDNIEHIHTTSPLTYRDFTATPKGSAYGIVKDCRSPLTCLIPVTTKIPNLFLTGQNMNVHGALGVSLTAALTCSQLLGGEYLAKKISGV